MRLRANTLEAHFPLVCFLFGRHFVGLQQLSLPRSSLIPCTLLFCLLKHRPHCCAHRGKASAELFCLYCKRRGESERACWKGDEAAILIVLLGSERVSLVWEEEKDVLCFVYDRVANAATGNHWARRQAFSGCSAASQPSRSFLLRSIRLCSRSRTNHAATVNSPRHCCSSHLRNPATTQAQEQFAVDLLYSDHLIVTIGMRDFDLPLKVLLHSSLIPLLFVISALLKCLIYSR